MKRKGCHREVGSKGSVEQMCESMDKKRIQGVSIGREDSACQPGAVHTWPYCEVQPGSEIVGLSVLIGGKPDLA